MLLFVAAALTGCFTDDGDLGGGPGSASDASSTTADLTTRGTSTSTTADTSTTAAATSTTAATSESATATSGLPGG